MPTDPLPLARPVARATVRRSLEAADVVVLLALATFAALAVGFRTRVEGWALAVVADLGVAALVTGAAVIAARLPHGALRFLVRTGSLSLAYAYLFAAVDRLQLIVHRHWLDGRVLAFEQRVFGTQPTLWLESFVRPWLTEWMMFAYVVYIALYPLVCGAIYARRGDRALEECLLALGLANVACDLGFIAFPVAGPSAFIASSFTVPLDGYLFTSLGELVRSKLHYVGGSLPSPHAAAATVLWVMAWKHLRWLAWALAPVVITLIVATFYCRFHYVSDAAAGIATAALALAAAAALLRRRRGPASPGAARSS